MGGLGEVRAAVHHVCLPVLVAEAVPAMCHLQPGLSEVRTAVHDMLPRSHEPSMRGVSPRLCEDRGSLLHLLQGVHPASIPAYGTSPVRWQLSRAGPLCSCQWC